MIMRKLVFVCVFATCSCASQAATSQPPRPAEAPLPAEMAPKSPADVPQIAPTAAELAAKSRKVPRTKARLPLITVKPSLDPNNRAFDFISCAAGQQAACALAGSWLAIHADLGHEIQVCLVIRAATEAGDKAQCIDIEAKWPE